MTYHARLLLPVAFVALAGAVAAGEFSCPKCEKTFAKAGTCPDDGSTLRSKQAPKQTGAKPAKAKPSKAWSCPKCGVAYTPGTKTCSKDDAAIAGPPPDLSHVRAGQDYVFEMEAAGTDMKMIYRVTKVEDGKITYEVITVIDIGGEVQEMPATEQTWPYAAPNADPHGEAPEVETKDLPNETITVSNLKFSCKVIETSLPDGATTSKIWTPMKPDGVMTFPPFVKLESSGGGADTSIVLVAVEGAVGSDPAAAVAALEAIASAQAIFRNEDKDGNNTSDYAGSLASLGRAKLIDAELAGGTKGGYRFELTRAAKTPKDDWLATASPISGKGLHFAVNHKGAVHQSKTAFQHNGQCELRGGHPVGK